jgi:hypothetical protein
VPGKAVHHPLRKPSYAQRQAVPSKNKSLRRAQINCQILMKGNRILRIFRIASRAVTNQDTD